MPRAGLATKTYGLIDAARDTLELIQPASVRAVCYKLFVNGHIPDMSKNSTNKVSRALVTAREKDWVPWEWIVDEGRSIERMPSWDDPLAFVETVRNAYRKDFWTAQSKNVVVVSEKGTIRGSIQPALDEYGVSFVALHGFSSATTFRDLARMSAEVDRETHWLYIGDWDPSGRYMSEVDIFERLRRYGGRGYITRVAVSYQDTIDLPDDLTFRAQTKTADSRYEWFMREVGNPCIELDAIDPRELRTRLTDAIVERIDQELWDRAVIAQEAETKSIREFVSDWKNLFSGGPRNRSEAA